MTQELDSIALEVSSSHFVIETSQRKNMWINHWATCLLPFLKILLASNANYPQYSQTYLGHSCTCEKPKTIAEIENDEFQPHIIQKRGLPGSRILSSALVFLHPGARTEGEGIKKVMSLQTAVQRGSKTKETHPEKTVARYSEKINAYEVLPG